MYAYMYAYSMRKCMSVRGHKLTSFRLRILCTQLRTHQPPTQGTLQSERDMIVKAVSMELLASQHSHASKINAISNGSMVK